MYWWDHAADLTRHGKLERFGLITTNSISQTFNRRVLEHHMSDPKHPLSIVFAIPDHPWVDSTDGAAVRIAMTVVAFSQDAGVLGTVVSEASEVTEAGENVRVVVSEVRGTIHPDIKVGANATGLSSLTSNRRMSYMGVILCGDGFFVDGADATEAKDDSANGNVLAKYLSGTDLVSGIRGRSVIDFTGLSESEARVRAPPGSIEFSCAAE